MTYAEGGETIAAGDLFCLPPGHTAFVEEDAEIVEFSPPAQHESVTVVVRRNELAAPV